MAHELTEADFAVVTAEDMELIEMAVACAVTDGLFDLDDVIAELDVEEE